MLADDDHICPLCGAICDSLTAYHKHYLRMHDGARVVWGAGKRPQRDGLTVADFMTPAEEIARLG